MHRGRGRFREISSGSRKTDPSKIRARAAFGFRLIAKLLQERQITSPESFGFDLQASLAISDIAATYPLEAEAAMGFTLDAVLTHGFSTKNLSAIFDFGMSAGTSGLLVSQMLSASFDFGFDNGVALSHTDSVRNLSAALAFGFSETPVVEVSNTTRPIGAAFDFGFNSGAAIVTYPPVVISAVMSFGFDEAAAIIHIPAAAMFTAAFALGFSQTATVSVTTPTTGFGLAFGGGQLHFYNSDFEEVLASPNPNPFAATVVDMCLAPGLQLVAVSGVSGTTNSAVYDYSSGVPTLTAYAPNLADQSVDFSPDESMLVSAGNGFGTPYVRVFETAGWTLHATPTTNASHIPNVACFSPDGNYVIVGAVSGRISAYSLSTGAETVLATLTSSISHIKRTPDNTKVIAITGNGQIATFDSSLSTIATNTVSGTTVQSVSIGDDYTYLGYSTTSPYVQRVDYATATRSDLPHSTGGYILGIAISKDGSTLYGYMGAYAAMVAFDIATGSVTTFGVSQGTILVGLSAI